MTIQEKARVRELHQNLADTDFKVIKCYEAQLMGEKMPYDVEALIVQRREWRKELNELEALGD